MDPEAVALAKRLENAHSATWSDLQVVDPEEAARYADLHGYVGDAPGIPPGYGAALTMRTVLVVLHDETIALPFDRNVHAAQTLEWDEPLRALSRITTTARIGNVKLRARAVFFDVLTESIDERNRTCLRGTATQAVRHV
ncbi:MULTISPECIES: hypothetical protein [unclassified Aeromicrobium]|uniref:hypothetical protein n=1 Tax=unclassified Aeromicrobium TaxID=2633570 RepID=UPI00288AB15D|nr:MULTISPECIES: hypothetical protein [unclassified Aeromicrobium]